jgi:ferredoxin
MSCEGVIQMALNAEKVKEVGRAVGADLVGIASIDRFEGAPLEMHPASILPEAESVIVLAFRILRGALRGIEEGTYFAAYPSMCYAGINLNFAPKALYDLSRFIEDNGYEAVPYQNMVIDASVDIHHGTPKGRKPVVNGRSAPDVLLHFRIAATAAGLGEIGYSKVFLTPQFGPRQRLAAIITDAPLKPDPQIPPGTICDRCMNCVRECPVGAISGDKTVSVKIGNYTYEWGELDVDKCTLAYTGGIKENNPFAPDDMPPLEEALNDIWGTLNKVPYNRNSVSLFHHYGAIGGAKGCIRACMIHLEETGRISNKFEKPFRRRPAWWLS